MAAATRNPFRFKCFKVFSLRLMRTWIRPIAIVLSLCIALTAEDDFNDHRESSELPENLIRIAGDWFCGGQPETKQQFKALADLGIRTLVSVDGCRPNLELAASHGMRYVHIPVGYDAIDETAAGSLANLSRQLEGKIFVHCHHGRHRGPAAASIAVMAAGLIDHDQAHAILARAGTGREYAGLWRDVAAFQTPSSETALPQLVEVAATSSIIQGMSQLDRATRRLTDWQKRGWRSAVATDDGKLDESVVALQEGFRESMRDHRMESSPAMAEMMNNAKQLSDELRDQIKADNRFDASRTLQQLTESCQTCHRQHRNQ